MDEQDQVELSQNRMYGGSAGRWGLAPPTSLFSGQPVKDSKHSPQLQNQGEIKEKAKRQLLNTKPLLHSMPSVPVRTIDNEAAL